MMHCCGKHRIFSTAHTLQNFLKSILFSLYEILRKIQLLLIISSLTGVVVVVAGAVIFF